MVPTIVGEIGTAQLEWVNYWVFVPLFVLSAIGVILGVYLEHHDFPGPTQNKGWRLLLLSLGLETFFGILIFAADGRVSSVQREEIRSQQQAITHLVAPRQLTPEQESPIAAGQRAPDERREP
jgi:hypothetical protein